MKIKTVELNLPGYLETNDNTPGGGVEVFNVDSLEWQAQETRNRIADDNCRKSLSIALLIYMEHLARLGDLVILCPLITTLRLRG